MRIKESIATELELVGHLSVDLVAFVAVSSGVVGEVWQFVGLWRLGRPQAWRGLFIECHGCM